MKKISVATIVPIIAMAVAGAGVYGVSRAVADSNANKSTIVQEIADTFKLDKAKVQAVFDKHKNEVRVDHQARYEERLNQAVSDKKLTSAQKKAILAEHKKLQSQMEAARTSGTNKRENMEKIRSEATDWAKQNDIDVKWLMFGGERIHGKGVNTENFSK